MRYMMGLLTLYAVLIFDVADAVTIHIPADYSTIQAGIIAAENGDTILVSSGTYVENIDFLGKSVFVTSVSGSDSTFFEQYSSGTAIVSFLSGENGNAVLDGFLLQNSLSSPAVYISESSPTIRRNVFINNNNDGQGGGISSKNSSFPIIVNNIFIDNSAYRGAGIDSGELTESDVRISRNIFISNSSGTHGGAVFIRHSNFSEIDHNVFYQNHCLADGGAMDLSQCSNIEVYNNTIAFNTNDERWQAGGVSIWISESCNVYNNIIVGNTGTGLRQDPYQSSVATFNDVWNNELDYDGISPGEGSISADPLFVGGVPFDFHLQPESPCIDAGDPESPNDPDGSIADMGAFSSAPVLTSGLDIEDIHAENGQEAVVPIMVNGIDQQEVGGVEFHIGFDDTCVEFLDFSSDYLSNPLVNVAAGVINVLWEDYENPLTFPDSVSAGELHFTVLGQIGDTCTLEWTDINELVDPQGEVIDGIDWIDGSIAVIEFHSITGNVVYYDMFTPVSGVTADLSGDYVDSDITDENGTYSFETLFPGSFTICPSRTDNDPGVTVTDVVNIRRHIVRLESLSSPFMMLAADVNGSGSVSVADVVKIRRYLAELEDLPIGNWTFVDSSFAIDEGNWPAAPACLDFDLWDTDLVDSSFIGVRAGDVDYSWTQGRRRMPPPKFCGNASLNLDNCPGMPGEIVRMGVRVTGFEDVAGVEFHLGYPSEFLKFQGIESDIFSDPTVNCNGNGLHFVWEDIFDIVTLADGAEAASISFEILEGAPDSMEISFMSAHAANIEGIDFALETIGGYITRHSTSEFDDGSRLPAVYHLGQNYPNPFNARTTIFFELPEPSYVTLEICDLLGREITVLAERDYPAGYHRVIWDATEQSSGLYFVKIRAGAFSSARKILLLK